MTSPLDTNSATNIEFEERGTSLLDCVILREVTQVIGSITVLRNS